MKGLKDKLRKGKETSVANFVSKLNVRRDSVYERLSPDLELLYENEVLWHASCYVTYTSTQNIKYATASKTSVVVEEYPAFTSKTGQNACFAKIGPTRKRR